MDDDSDSLLQSEKATGLHNPTSSIKSLVQRRSVWRRGGTDPNFCGVGCSVGRTSTTLPVKYVSPF